MGEGLPERSYDPRFRDRNSYQNIVEPLSGFRHHGDYLAWGEMQRARRAFDHFLTFFARQVNFIHHNHKGFIQPSQSLKKLQFRLFDALDGIKEDDQKIGVGSNRKGLLLFNLARFSRSCCRTWSTMSSRVAEATP